MLYVPNGFEMFETKWVQVSHHGGGGGGVRNKSMGYSKIKRHTLNSIENKIIPPSITIKSLSNK
jgi:hypothetical protein